MLGFHHHFNEHASCMYIFSIDLIHMCVCTFDRPGRLKVQTPIFDLLYLYKLKYARLVFFDMLSDVYLSSTLT